MVTVEIEHGDGTKDVIPQTSGWSRKRELGKMRRVTITVDRQLVQNITLNEKQDIVHLGDIDSTILVDVEKGGSTWDLVTYSFEWAANRIAPTSGGVARSGTDEELITTLIGEVPDWEIGTVNSFTSGMNFVFNHAHRHEALRRIERNTTGEVQFSDEGTLDYTSSLGTDRSGSVELSAAQGTIEDTIRITERGRELDGTHVRVIGAHEGEAQIFANLVPSADPNSYENAVTYSTTRWSQGDDRDWDRWENKDITDQSTMDEEAASLADEITDSLVEAKATVAGVSPTLNVGDYVQVVKPDADLDKKMRVHRVTTEQSGTTRRDKLLLSTRTLARNENVDDLRSIRQFNTGFQGSSVTVTGGPLRAAIDSENDVTLNFRYPNIEFENAAQLHVRGLQYRVDAQGAASGGGATRTTTEGGRIDDTTTQRTYVEDYVTTDKAVSDGATPATVTFTDIDSDLDTWVTVTGEVNTTSNPPVVVTVKLFDGDTTSANEIDTTSVTVESGGRFVASTAVGDISRQAINLTVEVDATDAALSSVGISNTDARLIGVPDHTHGFRWKHSHEIDIPEHTHQTQPGIFRTEDTPSNVDVEINNTTVATNIGSGVFETTVDISGEMTIDSWNDITLTSDALGLIQATVFVTGYDQIGKQ